MDKSTRFTVLPFVVSMLVAVFAMPTNVVAINRFEMGHEHLQPWRSKTHEVVSRAVTRVVRPVRDALAYLWGHPLWGPALAGAAMLAAAALLPHQDAFAAAALMAGRISLKEARQSVADVDQRLATNDQSMAEVNRDINAIIDATEKDKRAMKDDEKTKLADLRARKASLSEIRTTLMDQRAAASRELADAEAANEAERHERAVDDADRDTASRIQMGQDRTELDPKRGFRTHTEQLKAIMDAETNGVVDKRLHSLSVARAKAAAGGDEQGTFTNPHGGFFLAPAYQPDILSVQAEADPLAGLVRSFPMTSERVVFNARVDKNHATSVSGGLTVARTPQTKAAALSRTEYETVELVAHDLCGVASATNRILQTSPISFLTVLQSGFRDEFAAKAIDERLNGDGNMEFEGVVNADCTISIGKETGQGADTIVFENINNMIARCWMYGSASCRWLANQDTRPQLTTLYIPIGTGGVHVPIYSPPDETAPQGRLMGAPVIFTEFCQKLGDKGDIVLGCWSEFLEGTLAGSEEYASSVHVRFLEREQTFLFVVANAAKPWWRSALTPKYSTTKSLSPFIVLAAR